MTRNSVLAELLYNKAIEMKTSPLSSFRLAVRKNQVYTNLSLMQFLAYCLSMETISACQSERILAKLVSDFYFSDAAFAEKFKNAKAENSRTPEYQDILFLMNDILSSCMAEILRKRPDKTKLRRLFFAFHNLPRAFLSLSDRRKITPAEAIDYAHSYLL